MRGLPAGAGAYRAYSVSRPIRRWKTSDLFATVRHYRVTKVSPGLALAVGANSRQGRGDGPGIEWLADRLRLLDRGRGRRGSRVLVHIRLHLARGEREAVCRRAAGEVHLS